MRTMTYPARSVYPPASAPRQLAGRLLITIIGSGETIIQHVGDCECEGLASAALAERLRPQLDALDRAASRLAGAKQR